MIATSGWPDDWAAKLRGDGCGMCENRDVDELPGGIRWLDGRWVDVYLGRWPLRLGYSYAVWKGRHVVEPTDLTPEESAGFWTEVAQAARAIERHYQPSKMNWLVLGNGVPHLHVHLVPRPSDDARAGAPIESEAFERAREHPLDIETVRGDVAVLRSDVAVLRGLVDGQSNST